MYTTFSSVFSEIPYARYVLTLLTVNRKSQINIHTLQQFYKQREGLWEQRTITKCLIVLSVVERIVNYLEGGRVEADVDR